MVVINQTLAKKYYPDEDPIGKRYGDTSLSAPSMKEIVGIVDDIREGALDAEIWPAEYVPFEQDPDNFFTVVARTSQTEASVLPAMNAAIRAIDPDMGARRGIVMRDRIQDSPAAYLQRSSAWLVGGFAALALLLGIVGLYGVVAYSVSQRTREIGLRLAMGAERRSVYELILGEAGRLIAVGLLLGVVCSIAAARLMRTLLFDTSPWDVTTLAAVAAVLAIAAMLASYIPAQACGVGESDRGATSGVGLRSRRGATAAHDTCGRDAYNDRIACAVDIDRDVSNCNTYLTEHRELPAAICGGPNTAMNACRKLRDFFEKTALLNNAERSRSR